MIFPTKLAACATAASFLLAWAPPARAGDYEEGLRCWRAHDYRGAYEVLVRFREQPHGRNAQVDYMLGTSGCALDDYREWGQSYLEWMLRRYALPEDCRVIVENALQQCRATMPPLTTEPVSVDRLAEVIGATSRLSGKMYYFIGADEAVNNFAAVRVRQVDLGELRARLVPLDQPESAIASVTSRLRGLAIRAPVKPWPATFSADVEGRFLLVAKEGKTAEDLHRMAQFLERYLSFLVREYQVIAPTDFITVYLVSTPEDLAELAYNLHGLRIGRATFGYSFRDDLSVVAVVPAGFTVGTVQHELFHLVVRSTFGDVPQWLDEGLASLYEVSRLDPDPTVPAATPGAPRPERCTGLSNWRWKVLNKLWSKRPSLLTTITSDWYAFEQPDRAEPAEFMQDREESPPSAEMMAVTLATARYFMLYLQEQQHLRELYTKLQAQRPTADHSHDARAAAVAAVEEVMGKPIGVVDGEFAAWFKRLPPPTP
jgi:hypothetical protein